MLTSASTHDVLNQAPPIVPYNVFTADLALGEALVGPLSAANGGGSHEPLIATLVQFCEEALPRAHERVHA